MLSKMICGCAWSPSPKLITNAAGTGWKNWAIDMGKDEVTFVRIDEFCCTERQMPLCLFCCLFLTKGFLYPRLLLTGCIVGDDLELMILLPLHPECQ